MAMRQGETYDCPNPDCGCQIQVLRSANPTAEGNNDNPRCCCGEEMQLHTTAGTR